MTAVVVDGIGGRMGHRLGNLILLSDDLVLAGATERSDHEAIGKDAGSAIGAHELGVVVSDSLDQVIAGAHVVVSFTAPEAALATASACASRGAALVIGTTGLSPSLLAEFRQTVAPIACVFAPNFSTAMNVLFKLVEQAARILGDDYDVEVVEAHHRHKADAPSGSALRLGASAAAGLDRNLSEVAVHGREGAVGERSQKEIGMHAVRLGDLAGDHSVFFGAEGEYLELKHHATSRDAFALGALRAVRYAVAAPPGLYDMGDVLGLS